MIVTYITHPDVVIDPRVPVPEWDLSGLGRQRLEAMLDQPWLASVGAIFASTEQKAITTAMRMGQALGLAPTLLESLGEIDRSSTGYLPRRPDDPRPDRLTPPDGAPLFLDQVVQAFFDQPEDSAYGWERAIDAQRRIVEAVEAAISGLAGSAPFRHVAIIGHGGVGTLLLCRVKRAVISRAEAPPGQGYYFAFEYPDWRLLHGWLAIDG